MNRFGAVIGLAFVFGAVIWWYGEHAFGPQAARNVDYKSASYYIEGKLVTLINGESHDGGMVTRYFGNEGKGDLNGDGLPDMAFILTQSGGGSGTFYYVVAALVDTRLTYLGTNAVLLGDRIAPQSTEIKNGQLIVNYATRYPNEPMTTPPSVGVSKYLVVKGSTLKEVK